MLSAFLSRIQKALLILLFGTFVFSFTVNLWVQRKLPFIESALSEAFDRPVEIGRAGYDPFRGFFFDTFTVKEIKTVPFPFTVRRVRAVPSFALYPAPRISIRKVIFEDPVLGLAGRPEELFRAGSLIRKLPAYRTTLGAGILEMNIEVFKVHRGRVSVFTQVHGGEVRQEFEDIEFFAGKKWFHDNAMRLSGRIAGKPQARFRIESDLLREAPGTFDGNVRIDLHEFTTSYLEPYLKGRFHLPQKNLTASLRLKIRDGSRIESSGQFDLPSIGFDDRLLRYLTHRPPKLEYFLQAVWKYNTVEFSKIHIKGRALRLAGQGQVNLAEGRESYHFSLDSGNMPAEKFRNTWKPWKLDSGHIRLSLEAAGTARSAEPRARVKFSDVSMQHALRDWRLSKMDGEFLVTPRGVRVTDLWAFFNDMPFRAGGELRLWNGPRSVSLEVSTYPGQLPGLKASNPLNGSIFIRAGERQGSWRGYFHTGKLVMAFKGLQLKDGRCEWLALHRRSFALRSVRFFLRYNTERARLDVTEARAYGGHARGTYRIGLKDHSWKTRWDIRGTRFSPFSNSFLKGYPADGNFNLRLHAAGGFKKELSLGFRFRLTDGTLGPSPSLSDWARQTGIDGLRSIRFESFSGNARFNKGLWELEKLDFSSDTANFTANMEIRGQRVNGRLSTRFPANAVHPSSDLARLLRFAGEEDRVDLDFHVAGALGSPRIEWMPGEFRKKIETRLPPFLREEIYRRIEQRFAPAAKAS